MIYDDDELWINSDQCTFDWYDEITEVAARQEKRKKRDKDGCFCEKCKEFYPYAEPNSKNETLICYSCRNPW